MFALAAKLNPELDCELPAGDVAPNAGGGLFDGDVAPNAGGGLLGGDVAPNAGAGCLDGAPKGVAVVDELPPPKENIPEPELPVELCCGVLVLVLDDCPNWKRLGVAEAGFGADEAEPKVVALDAPKVEAFELPNDGG